MYVQQRVRRPRNAASKGQNMLQVILPLVLPYLIIYAYTFYFCDIISFAVKQQFCKLLGS